VRTAPGALKIPTELLPPSLCAGALLQSVTGGTGGKMLVFRPRSAPALPPPQLSRDLRLTEYRGGLFCHFPYAFRPRSVLGTASTGAAGNTVLPANKWCMLLRQQTRRSAIFQGMQTGRTGRADATMSLRGRAKLLSSELIPKVTDTLFGNLPFNQAANFFIQLICPQSKA
jgi:hypothetical protein